MSKSWGEVVSFRSSVVGVEMLERQSLVGDVAPRLALRTVGCLVTWGRSFRWECQWEVGSGKWEQMLAFLSD